MSLITSATDKFLNAASHRNYDEILNLLNQEGSSLAKAKGRISYSIGNLTLVTDGNALHHTIAGQGGLLEAMDDRITNIATELLKAGCDANEKNRSHQTPLHYLCQETDLDLELTTFKDLDTEESREAKKGELKGIIEANKVFKLRLAELLLQNGAKPTIPNDLSLLPIQLIKEDQDFQNVMHVLFKKYHPQYLAEGMLAVQEHQLQRRIITAFQNWDSNSLRVALQDGANPNMSISGIPLIANALIQGNEQAFDMLMQARADLRVKFMINLEEYDLLDFIHVQFSPHIFSELLRSGHNPNRPLPDNEKRNFAAHFTRVYWHTFALAGNVEAIQILLNSGLHLEIDTKDPNRKIWDLLLPDALKNDPFLIASKADHENSLKDQTLKYEIVKIIDLSPQIRNSVDELPPEIKSLEQRYKIEEVEREFFQLVRNPVYREVARSCKQMFAEVEKMKSLLKGGNERHSQILKLVDLHNKFGKMGRLFFSITK